MAHASRRRGAKVRMHPTRSETVVGALERALDAVTAGETAQGVIVMLDCGDGRYRLFHTERTPRDLLWDAHVLHEYATED
jgi:hypothetical protein